MSLYKFPQGIGVALITPFFSNGKIDFGSLGKMINHVINNGVDYIVSLGTTGESVNLDEQEIKDIFDFTIKTTANRIPLVAGSFGGNNTHQLIERLDRYDLTGFSAILSSSPSYIKPTQEGIYQHFSALAKKSPLPIILYNVPGRTSSNVSAETCLRLANEFENIIAVKDASADIHQGATIVKNAPNHFSLLSGDDPSCLSLLANGGRGLISVIANAYPQEFSDMVHFALNDQFEEARKIHLKLLDIHHWLYNEGNPAGIKAACSILGFCEKHTRFPIMSMTEQGFSNLKREIKFV